MGEAEGVGGEMRTVKRSKRDPGKTESVKLLFLLLYLSFPEIFLATRMSTDNRARAAGGDKARMTKYQLSSAKYSKAV